MASRAYLAVCDELKELHTIKSSTYGNELDPFDNFTKVGEVMDSPIFIYPLERIVEKCVRAINMVSLGRLDEVEEFLDIAGLAICLEALRREGG